MDDLLESIKRHIQDRISSPLGGACVVSLVLWNFKLFVVLFSSIEPAAKLDYIETTLYPDTYHIWVQGVLFPVLSALAYIFIYPYPSIVVYSFTLDMQKKLRLLKQKKYDETPLTLEESRKLIAETKARLNELQSQIDANEETISELRSDLAASKNTNSDLVAKLTVAQSAEQRALEDNDNLKSDLEQLSKDAVKLKSTILDFQRAVNSAASDTEQSETSLTSKQAKLHPLSHGIAELPLSATDTLAKYTTPIDKLVAGMDPVTKHLSTIDAISKLTTPALEQYRAAVGPMEDHIRRATDALDQYQDILNPEHGMKNALAAITAAKTLEDHLGTESDKDK